MPAPTPIKLSVEEEAVLKQHLTSGKTPIRVRERSQIVLLAAAGLLNYQIAEDMGIDVNKVGRWRNRYALEGYAGIEKDRPRGANHGGKNTSDQARLRSLIIKKTTTEKPDGATNWSTRSLTAELGTSRQFVATVWREAGLRRHLHRQFKVSNDPLFEEKLHDVVGFFLSTHQKRRSYSVSTKRVPFRPWTAPSLDCL